MLEGFDPGISDPNDFISLSEQADATVVAINADGQSADTVSLVALASITVASVDALISDGNLVVSASAS